MCGLVALLHLDGRPVDPRELVAMRDLLEHRGPDEAGSFVDGSVGLGQLMLHSTPESLHETLPWKDPQSGLVITADARIDNREELLSKLKDRLSRPASLPQGADLSDSFLILEAYKRWGEACVDHLLGDFAFVIWDGRRQKLYCARDHMGIRPFYYYLTNDLFVFASSALGVVSVNAVPKRINELRIADYLVPELEGADKTCTWFEEVWRMPPAHIATLSDIGFQMREYWQPDPEFELKLASDEEYTDAFEEVLTTAIKARTRSHKPCASMLSGGLDSSTIVGIACKLQLEESGAKFASFSGVSEEGNDCRETRYSRMLSGHDALVATELRPSDVAHREKWLLRVDEILEDPFDSSWILLKMIYLDAREKGHVAVMDGIDGDGVASLTTYYPVFLIRNFKLLSANREILGIWKNMHRKRYPFLKEYTDVLRPVLVPKFARRIKHSLMPPALAPYNQDQFIRPEFASRIGLQERLAKRQLNCDLLSCKSTHHSHAKRILVPYLTAGIERYGRLAAYCGVEQRQPLLDKRVIEFCVSPPWNQKVRNGWSKYGLRRLAERHIPHAMAWRRGWDQIGYKFNRVRDEYNREKNSGQLTSRAVQMSKWVDLEAFQTVYSCHLTEERTYTDEFRNVMGLAQFIGRHFP